MEVLPYDQQVVLYNTLKSAFGDTYNNTHFVMDEEPSWSYTAHSPKIEGELLCNLQSLDENQMKQLIKFQKNLLAFALKTWIVIDFFGDNPEQHKENQMVGYAHSVYKIIKYPFYSTNIISGNGELRFVDTFITKYNVDLNYKKYISFILVLWNFLLCLGIFAYKKTSNKGESSIKWSVY